jgi:hypothetical protein
MHSGDHLFEKQRYFFSRGLDTGLGTNPHLLFRLSLILFATRRLGEQPLGAA